MFDIDAGHGPTLRLDNPDKRPSAADEMADIERQMEVLCARHAELALDLGRKVAQAEPIPVSDGSTGWFVTDVRQDGETFSFSCRSAEPAVTSDNDFWTHRHRVMGGTRAKVVRADGSFERLYEDDGA